MTLSKSTVQAFYIVGENPKTGHKDELAKFFSQKDAKAHCDRYYAWHNVHVEARTESADAQHEAHRGAWK